MLIQIAMIPLLLARLSRRRQAQQQRKQQQELCQVLKAGYVFAAEIFYRLLDFIPIRGWEVKGPDEDESYVRHSRFP